jgi:hypothetical protein
MTPVFEDILADTILAFPPIQLNTPCSNSNHQRGIKLEFYSTKPDAAIFWNNPKNIEIVDCGCYETVEESLSDDRINKVIKLIK